VNTTTITESAAQWWGARRLRYNVALLLAGLGAFISYVALAWSFEEHLNQVEVTAFTVAFQAIGYFVAMGVANVCYFLGPLSERVVRPANLKSYRTVTYTLGLWFSVALPFLVPAVLAYVIVASGA
jgi:hypothetical protein